MTEKLLPDEVWVWLDPYDEMNVDTHGPGNLVPAVKYTRATPAPVSGEVDGSKIYSLFDRIEDGLDYLKSSNNRGGVLNDYWGSIQDIKLQVEELRSYDWASLEDTAAKTAAPEQGFMQRLLEVERREMGLQKENQALREQIAAPGFTREELVEAVNDFWDKNAGRKEYYKFSADVAIDALIDMGAVRVKP